MIETTFEEVNQQGAQRAVNKLLVCKTGPEGMDPGYGFQVSAVLKDFMKQCEKLESELQEAYKDLAEKNEDGTPKIAEITLPNGQKISKYVFNEENEKKAEEAGKIAGANKIILNNRPKLYLSKIAVAGLSVQELGSIDFMIDPEK